MPVLLRIVGAMLATYFVSRATLRLPLPLHGTVGLLVAHVLSLGLCVAVLIALRLPLGAFTVRQILLYLAAQAVWFIVDGLRRRRPRPRHS
ncbi:MAG: hypothetical protein JF593_14015 [Novosphingobium sp.]|nr:hypothetical protein [Novosphingobium sp.]